MQDADRVVDITDLLNPSDEFYTKLEDIESELSFYDRSIFKDAVIYCPFDCFNSDDLPLNSNYILYFKELAPILQFKSLVATTLGVHNNYYRLDRCVREDTDVVAEIIRGSEIYLFKTDGTTELKGDQEGLYYYKETISSCPFKPGEIGGNYSSNFCVKLLKSCDIVVTTPASSHVGKFVKLLQAYDKKFIMCISEFCVANNVFFEMFKAGKLFLGQTKRNTGVDFVVSSHYKRSNSKERSWLLDSGQRAINLGYYRFFTNIDFKPSYETLDLLTREENERKGVVYQEYDNLPGLNVDVTKRIPSDYEGIIGVPLTFIDYYNPNQFEIVGLTSSTYLKTLCTKTYDSLKLNQSAVVKTETGELKAVAKRILVRLKQVSVPVDDRDSLITDDAFDLDISDDDDWIEYTQEDDGDISQEEVVYFTDNSSPPIEASSVDEGTNAIQQTDFTIEGSSTQSIIPKTDIADWWTSLEKEEQFKLWGTFTNLEQERIQLAIIASRMTPADSGLGLTLAENEELKLMFAELEAGSKAMSSNEPSTSFNEDNETVIPEPNTDFSSESTETHDKRGTLPESNSVELELRAIADGLGNLDSLITEVGRGIEVVIDTQKHSFGMQDLIVADLKNLLTKCNTLIVGDEVILKHESVFTELNKLIAAWLKTSKDSEAQLTSDRTYIIDTLKSLSEFTKQPVDIETSLKPIIKMLTDSRTTQSFFVNKVTALESKIIGIEKQVSDNNTAIDSLATKLDTAYNALNQINAKLDKLLEPKKKFLW